MLDRISINQLKIVPVDVNQFFYVNKVFFCDGFLSNLPRELFNLNLIKLDISSNNITFLPREIGRLTNILELNIIQNKLDTLPKEILKLVKLKHMYINHNKYMHTIGNYKSRLRKLRENGFIN